MLANSDSLKTGMNLSRKLSDHSEDIFNDLNQSYFMINQTSKETQVQIQTQTKTQTQPKTSTEFQPEEFEQAMNDLGRAFAVYMTWKFSGLLDR